MNETGNSLVACSPLFPALVSFVDGNGDSQPYACLFDAVMSKTRHVTIQSNHRSDTAFSAMNSSGEKLISPTKSNSSGGSNNRGDKVYYRLLTFNAPYTSFYPIDSEDSSLSFIHSSRIPVPGLASDFLTHICSRERIHHSRAQLFTTSRARATSVYSSSLSAHERKIQALPDDPAYTLAPPVEPLRLVPGGCGTSRANPIVLYLDLDPSMDRTTAAHPINGLERAGRRFAKAVQKVVGVVVTGLTICFGTLQKVPKGME
ncbi:hypothetical protein PNOK_0655800 [Pyrrhoderma noxium]|uniref:Uncharacterized protein n=1 Tax=Pyrrhoderma noxium TaxID=2282107 RepID=A0A286UEM2_9AGAM|nr:hypothetical protein PNOK_0655800 [Pyrrhoderma noxium]